MGKERDRPIDFFKVLLVIGMIIAHCIQLLGQNYSKVGITVSNFINLITFSGFMFCFGYAVNIAYLQKTRQDVYKKIIRNCIKLLIVFYISSITHDIYITQNFSLSDLKKILIVSRVGGYSEFIAAFVVLNILTLIIFNQFKKMLKNKIYFWIVFIVSLLSTFIPYSFYQHIKVNQFGLIIGSTQFASFPILQYLSYYLLGAYFQQNKIKFNFKYALASFFGTDMFLLYTHISVPQKLPQRFPPSIMWIIGASGYLYAYYIISICLSSKIKRGSGIYLIGENTIYFLLGSNVILFMLWHKHIPPLNFVGCIELGLAIIVAIYIIVSVCKNVSRSYKVSKLKEQTLNQN